MARRGGRRRRREKKQEKLPKKAKLPLLSPSLGLRAAVALAPIVFLFFLGFHDRDLGSLPPERRGTRRTKSQRSSKRGTREDEVDERRRATTRANRGEKNRRLFSK